MKAYALWNRYADETSVGFDNTWSAFVFDSRAQRDKWLEGRTDMASRACTRKEAMHYTYRFWGDRFLANPITDDEIKIA